MLASQKSNAIAEPDNFGGWNNRFEWNPEHIPYPDPEVLNHHAPSEFSEDTEIESVLGVESVADTISEYADDDGYHDEPMEFVDAHDVDDPEFPSGTSWTFVSNVVRAERG